MHPERLLLPLVLVTTVLLLPGPADATLGLAALGAILAPAALLALPGGPLLLGLGAVGLKFVIASRLLSLLCGWIHSRTDRGITLKKEFVHIPARDMAHQPSDVATADLAHLPPAFTIPKAAAQPAPVLSFPASPFSLPYPYSAPQSNLDKSFKTRYSSPQAAVGVAKSSVPSASFFIGRHEVRPSPKTPFPPILQDNGFVVPSSGIIFTSVPEAAPAARHGLVEHHGPVALKGQKTQPATGGTFDQILRIAQSPAVTTLVSNNPDLVVRFLQGIAGVSSRQTAIGTAHSNAGLTVSRIGAGDIEALLNFVRQDPNLVRNIVRADPGFVPSLVNNIIGVSNDGQGSSLPPPPPPPPPPSFSDSPTKDRSNDGTNKTSSELSDDKIPANVPIDSPRPSAPHPDLVLYAKKQETSPVSVSRPLFAFSPSVKGAGFVGTPQNTNSLVGYPSTFYTVPNHRPAPYEAYGFPADIPQPLPAVFSSSPWNVTTIPGLFNASQPKTERHVQATFLENKNERNQEFNQNEQPSVELPVQRPSQRRWPIGSYEIPEEPSKDARPQGSYGAPVVEEPSEDTLPTGSYGVSSVEEPKENDPPSPGYGTSRVQKPSRDTPTASGYGIPPAEEPSEDELPTGGYGTPPIEQPSEKTRPAGSYGVPPVEESIEETLPPVEPTISVRPAGGYGVSPEVLPSEDPLPEDPLPEGGYGVGPAERPSKEQDSGYGSPPVQPVTRPGHISSYPTPPGDRDASPDEDVKVVTSPPLGQEIPTSGASSDDIYQDKPGNDGDHTSGASTTDVQGTHGDPIKEAAKPPAVRPVFVPVTGKFRFDAIKSILGVARNAAGFPANVYDPVAFWAQANKGT
ncbi:unnamed protein product [Ixodes pacificus]